MTEPNASAVCCECRSSIDRFARRCPTCGSWQGVRRWLDIAPPALSAVVALLSLLGVLWALGPFVFGHGARLYVSSFKGFGPHLAFVVYNSGDRPGLVGQVALEAHLHGSEAYVRFCPPGVDETTELLVDPGRAYQIKLNTLTAGFGVSGMGTDFREQLTSYMNRMFSRKPYDRCFVDIETSSFAGQDGVIRHEEDCETMASALELVVSRSGYLNLNQPWRSPNCVSYADDRVPGASSLAQHQTSKSPAPPSPPR